MKIDPSNVKLEENWISSLFCIDYKCIMLKNARIKDHKYFEIFTQQCQQNTSILNVFQVFDKYNFPLNSYIIIFLIIATIPTI